jgi:putative CocE/NonD family hydrolase
MSRMRLERQSAVVFLVMLAGVIAAAYAGHRYESTPHPKPPYFDATEVMIPMRDGIKLQTILFVPKGAHEPLPILLKRTPYGVNTDSEPDPAGVMKELIKDGYIFAYQNIRGRFKSEGTFVMIRPVRDRSDPGDAKAVDESTDAYDTIEWLVHNVPKSTGSVCTRGVSYDGWTTAMSLIDPHPALKCASEQASPSDMFVNDDFHHNGTFRLSYGFEYSAGLETAKDKNTDFEFGQKDTYDWYLALGALSNADSRFFHETIPTWEDFVAHPNRDDYWKARAIGTTLVHTTVPNLNVAGWWDQEDFVGPMDIYDRLEKTDTEHTNYLVVGPWNHGGWWNPTGRRLGVVDFASDTAKEFRLLQARWFAHWLHGAPLDLPEATVFETGSNTWKKLDAWPPRSGVTETKLYFHAGRRLSFEAPTETGAAFDSYVSDPKNPVPYRHRPIGPTYPGPEWPVWLVEDQRFVDHRPDVLSWETEPLDHDVVLLGNIEADLYASTTGTDADWAVKLIDVYPEGNVPGESDAGDAGGDASAEDAGSPLDLRGYELIIADDVLRGRFRSSLARPEPVPSDTIVKYRVDLHSGAHAFLRGHRIMVQLQSTWFPLYDRNPQKYVENIYQAKDEDFVTATQRVFRSREAPSSVVLSIAE